MAARVVYVYAPREETCGRPWGLGKGHHGVHGVFRGSAATADAVLVAAMAPSRSL